MKLGRSWLMRHWSETYVVRVGLGLARTAEQVQVTEQALSAILWDYPSGDPVVGREIERIHHELFGLGPRFSAQPREQIKRDLERAARSGRLTLVPAARPTLPARRNSTIPVPSGLAPEPEAKPGFFEARLVDEIGEPISGLKVIVTAEGKANELTTDGSGKVRLDGVHESFASLRVANMKALSDILEPRWEKARPGKMPVSDPMTRTALDDTLQSISLTSELAHLIVIHPPLGKIFVELSDRLGRVRHANRKYTIEGPMSFEGTTDEAGRLLHEGVLAGDYTLKLTLTFFEKTKDEVSEVYESPLVALDAGVAEPQRRMLGRVPYSVFARARGFVFDTEKTFLLPSAIPALANLRDLYEQNEPSELLIVGHTDTTGDTPGNDALSLERAKSVKAYLEDDVDAWLANYDASGKKKWGVREDRLMILAMPDFPLRGRDERVVEWFQRTRDLDVDGICGPVTRRQLITEYMALDGVSLAGDDKPQITVKTHGAGEHFPLADTGLELDTNAADEQEDALDRRAELFFFDPEFGIRPAPGAAGGPEYLTWRKDANEVHDFSVDSEAKEATVIEVHDALFRTNSCVVLPAGEAPSADQHQALTSVGLFATALRFNEENLGKTLFIAGHTDTSATENFNQKLSDERAQCTLALLVGDREQFAKLADARHTVGDYKQILSFFSRAFAELPVGEGGFTCDPGAIDDDAPTGEGAVRQFQTEYNLNKEAIGASAADLAVDGVVGKLTWGAIFDGLEFALRRSLDEDADGLAALRERLVFADDEHKALGFSEYFPIDQVGRDDVRSQANRRVEVLFFDEGEEPDLVLAASDPKSSELYLPGEYQQQAIVISPDELKRPQRNPVYFCALADDVPIMNFPSSDGSVVGTAKKGDLFRALAEKFEGDTYFVRVAPVAPRPTPSYYLAPAEGPDEQWIAVSHAGETFAFWSNLTGAELALSAGALDLNAMDDRFANGFLDV